MEIYLDKPFRSECICITSTIQEIIVFLDILKLGMLAIHTARSLAYFRAYLEVFHLRTFSLIQVLMEI